MKAGIFAMPLIECYTNFIYLFSSTTENKISLSQICIVLLFSFPDENNSLSQTIPDKPIELHHFVKLCEQRRKFPVLYKLEFQVSINCNCFEIGA